VSRRAAIDAFLAAQGWGAADRRPLAGDASFRRYERLVLDGRSAILMDAPPPESVHSYLAVGALLRESGFAVPATVAADQAEGLLLLEDFGDDTYARLLARGESEQKIYTLAVDLLIELHRRLPAERLYALPFFDEPRVLEGVGRFLAWYWPAIAHSPPPGAVGQSFIAAWRAVLPVWDGVPSCLVHYDYHLDNLMMLAGREGIAAVGLLDFQDAVRGSMSFDLVSLIDDARRDLPPSLSDRLIERYLAGFPEVDRAAFAAAFALAGAQRDTRILGNFARLWKRDGKPGYLVHIPRVWRQLERQLAHPALAPVSDWFERHWPSERRRVPEAV
jgi:N-acetylmuramate 1-kinase